MKRVVLFLLFLLCPLLHSQTSVLGIGDYPNQLLGWGAPGTNYICNAAANSMMYLQLDAGSAGMAPGFIWVCGSTTQGGAVSWRHLTLPQVIDASGNFLSETCAHVKVTSNTSGAWTATWPSIGSTITSLNATSVSTGTGVTASTQATIATATPTGASGSVITYSAITVALINISVPVLSSTTATVYVQVCATP